jgi:chromate transporter
MSIPDTKPDHGVTFAEAFRVWLRIASLSFGGPAGQIAVMHRILVEEKRWISESRFLHALSYCTLLPGPEAQQLATYVGWLMHRTAGGLMAGLLFILPGVIAIMTLSVIYAGWGHVGIVAAAFFGLKAAVLAIVIEAIFRVGRRALRNSTMKAIAAAAFVAIFFFATPFPVIIIAAGLIGWLGARQGLPAFAPGGGHGSGGAKLDGESLLGESSPSHTHPSAIRALKALVVWGAIWLIPVIAVVASRGTGDVFSRIAIFFSEMSMVTFGGAYAVLAYVAQEAVSTYHWVSAGEMLDGLGMAETTPGPLIMVLQFVGFMAAYRAPGALSPMLAGAMGGLLATWVTFAPCFLWIFLGGPYIEKLRGNKQLAGALSAITAAVVGVILNLAIWFAIHAIFRETIPVRGFGLWFDAPVPAMVDPWALLLALGAAIAIFRVKVGMIQTLAGCCLAGVAFYLAGLTR